MDPSRRRVRDLYAYFFGAYPTRTALMIVLMVVAGLAEGVGVLALIPVLEFADGRAEPTSSLGQAVVATIRTAGIEPELGVLLSGIVILISLKAVFLLLANGQVGYTQAQVTRDLRLQLMRAVLRVRWRYFSSRTIGQYTNAITTEANRASAAYREACRLLAGIVQIIAYLAVAALVSWKVAVGTIIIGLIMSRMFRGIVELGRTAGHLQTQLSRSLSSRLIDILQGIKPLKAMGREALVWPLLESETEGLNLAQRRQVLASEGLRSFQEPLLTLLLATGLFFITGVGDQPLSSVLLLAFVFYRLMQHINTLQRRYQVMTVGESAFFSIVEELSAARAAEEDPGGDFKLDTVRAGIELRGIRFAYDDRPVLESVDLVIPAGSFVAITGESGSGKTTLADLVAGLYDPDEGQILVDGTPLNHLELSAWRRSIGYVPQEMLLFNDTILRNVSLGDTSITRGQVERALNMAGALAFVREKSEGLDHRIGERGGMLSGGQRQRIAIARALVTNPSLLILDEVTTALDPATEQAICETLRVLAGEVTILSISHQPALREVSDAAYVMRDGRLETLRKPAVAR